MARRRKRIPYRPVCDDRVVVPACSAPTDERIYLRDLGEYLKVPATTLERWARRRGLYRRDREIGWVSVYSAMRIISYVRGRQGARLEAGINDFRTGRAVSVK